MSECIPGLKRFYTENKITAAYIILWPFLFFLSGVYLGILWFVKSLYRLGFLKAYKPSVKVISVGNITLGGSGKTPLVEYCADTVLAQGHRVAIVMRGYRRPENDKGIGLKGYYDFGDEGSMLKKNFKGKVLVEISRDRCRLVRRLEQNHSCDTVVLDDGFQHWALARDLDIVALDASNPFGNTRVLPLGHLREGLSSLKRADFFCLTHCDEVAEAELTKLESLLRRLNPDAGQARSIHAPQYLYNLRTDERISLDILKGAPAGLLCGIANPSSFQKSVERLGAVVQIKSFFEDHHEYRQDEIRHCQEACLRAHVGKLITTEKDAQRLGEFVKSNKLQVELIVLKISLKVIKGEEALRERLSSLYRP